MTAGPPVDHVLLAARSARDAERELDRLGLGSVAGHVIEGMGLTNFFVPLGPSMLEIHHPDGTAPAEGLPPFLAVEHAALAAHPDAVLMPVGWLVRIESEAELRARAAAVDMPVIESAPPGAANSLIVGLGVTFAKPWLPLLIHWPHPPAERPTAAPAAHRRAPTGELHLTVAGDADDIRDWCGGLPEHTTVVPGTTGPLRLSVPTADGGSLDFGPPT